MPPERGVSAAETLLDGQCRLNAFVTESSSPVFRNEQLGESDLQSRFVLANTARAPDYPMLHVK